MDDEGTPTNRTVLIEDGVLVGYLQDSLNARLMGVPVTGNARRESFAHAPMPRMTNTMMLAGSSDPAQIIASVKRGLYAVNFGGGQVDIVSGKYDGSLKAEHGTGRNMAPFVETEWGADGFEIVKRLKKLCDPTGLLNPGVIVNDDPRAHLANLKGMPRVEDEVDTFVRQKIAKLSRRVPEGGREWEILYRKYFGEEMAKRKL